MRFNENCIPEFAKGARCVAIVRDVTEEIANVARATAPVDSGEYVAEIRTEMIETLFRPVGKVIAGAEHSMLVESRTGTLARALNSVAGRG